MTNVTFDPIGPSSTDPLQRLSRICESWVGTPFRHAACVKGPSGGVDCIHFVVAALVEAGRLPASLLAEIPSYPRDWHLHSDDDRLTAGVTSRADLFQPEQAPLDGSICLYQFGLCSSHSALRVGDSIYHAVLGVGVIRSAVADEFWASRFRSAVTPVWEGKREKGKGKKCGEADD